MLAPLAAAVKHFADAGSELSDMSQRTGASVEALSGSNAKPFAPWFIKVIDGVKVAVIGMGILILAGLTAVIWRIVNLASSPKVAPPAVTSAAPPGHVLRSRACANNSKCVLPVP